MKPFILTPRAEQDVGDIWEYIAADSIEAADRVLQALEKALYRLARNPGIGHMREELADRKYRFFLVYSYLIVYRSETDPLQVIRVLHAARDVQSLLRLTSDEERFRSHFHCYPDLYGDSPLRLRPRLS